MWSRAAAALVPLGLLFAGVAAAASPPAAAGARQQMPAPTVDVAVTDRVDPPRIRAGQEARITVTARNNSLYPAEGVRVSHPLPSRVTLVRAEAGQGSFDPESSQWTVGSLPVKKSVTLTLVVRGERPGDLTAVGALAAVTPADARHTNDVASAPLRIEPRSADLRVTKSTAATPVRAGQEFSYTVTASNAGPDPASGVVVRDDGMLAPVTVVAATPGRGTVDQAKRRWAVGDLAVGESVTMTVRARLGASPPAGSVFPTGPAVVSAPSTVDPEPADNAAVGLLGETASPANVTLTHAAGAASVHVGRTVTLTVGAKNGGPSTATGVTVREALPAGAQVVSSSGSGSFDAKTGIWTVGTLQPGTSANRKIVVRVAQGGQGLAVASLASLGQADSSAPDNVAVAAVSGLEEADLAVTNSVDPLEARPGDTIRYTVRVTNQGPGAADDVEAFFPLHAGTVQSAKPSAGTVDAAGRWRIGALKAGSSATLAVSVRVDTGSDGTVAVTQASARDSVPADNLAEAALRVPGADLAVTRDVDNSRPARGQEVEFTVTASNAGPDRAAEVTVADVPTDGLSFVSADPSMGSYEGATGRWTIGDLEAGAEAVLVLRLRVEGSGEIESRSDIGGVGAADPVPENNSAITLLSATSPNGAGGHGERSGFTFPGTDIRFTAREAAIVGGLLMIGGLVLLGHARRT